MLHVIWYTAEGVEKFGPVVTYMALGCICLNGLIVGCAQ